MSENDDHNGDHQEQHESDVATATPELARPPFYVVVLFNDDYTPMEFVILVLQQYFGLDLDRATEVMLSVHYEGKGVAGMYPRDIAETKAQLVNRHARAEGHPLLCQIEPQSI
ncbi:MAG TPA: ATP-dependent Clp protease adapter ClpS [Aquirhabdus sp.]